MSQAIQKKTGQPVHVAGKQFKKLSSFLKKAQRFNEVLVFKLSRNIFYMTKKLMIAAEILCVDNFYITIRCWYNKIDIKTNFFEKLKNRVGFITCEQQFRSVCHKPFITSFFAKDNSDR